MAISLESLKVNQLGELVLVLGYLLDSLVILLETLKVNQLDE